MNLHLIRTKYRSDGIFGELRTDDQKNELIAVTLEHAFPGSHGNFLPVIPEGDFICERGEHYLHGMTTPFETFEVTGVDGHVGLLFHWGNFNKDSEGCILLGGVLSVNEKNEEMILNSKMAFEKFMALQKGLSSFELMVFG